MMVISNLAFCIRRGFSIQTFMFSKIVVIELVTG